MGWEVFPSVVRNKTSEHWLMIVDGNNGEFIKVGPGHTSDDVVSPWYVFRGVDAFGVYTMSGNGLVPCNAIFDGKRSSWWKIPDGTNVDVVVGEKSGLVSLIRTFMLPGTSPTPSSAEDWGG
jgi:hypothetical protein